MVVREVGAVAVDAPLVARARAAVATDQDDGLEQVRVVERQQERDAGADAAAAEHGARDAKVLHHAYDVVAHVLERVGRRHLGGAAIAADVDPDHLEPGREMRGLIHPQIVVERIGVHEHHGRTIARDLVPDVDAIRSADWHLQRLTSSL